MPRRIELSLKDVIAALIASDGRRGDAARALGISVATLRRRCNANPRIERAAGLKSDPKNLDLNMLEATIPHFPKLIAKVEEQRRLFSSRPRQLTEAEVDAFFVRAMKRQPNGPLIVGHIRSAIRPSAENGE